MQPIERPADAGSHLLALARAAIARALQVEAAVTDARGSWLDAPGACFVTLSKHGALRGCIGSLEAHRSLRLDVQANAVAAALHDPRFAPLNVPEFGLTDIEVSLLSAPQPLHCVDERDALAQLRPGLDGLVLVFGAQRSTFLPQVWEQLPDPRGFLAQLKRKAGLTPNFWHSELRLQRYTVEKWKENKTMLAHPA